MTTINNIFKPSTSNDPIQKAKDALLAVRQYQQDWQDYGVDRVHRYFDDVEGKWIEEFCAEPLTFEEMSPLINVDTIFQSLKALGFKSRSFVEQLIFPDWWNNEMEDDFDSIHNLIISLSRNLFLDVNLALEKSLFSFKVVPQLRYKLQSKQNEPYTFSCLAKSVAELTRVAIQNTYTAIPENPKKIRGLILQKYQSVNLEGLLEFCYEFGIPVIHFDKKLNGESKFDGMVTVCEDRPVIVISLSRKYSAWLAFILAHELGHIAKRHILKGMLVDTSFSDGERDPDEDEADSFASKLLFGDSDLKWSNKLSPNDLLSKARSLSDDYRIDSGAAVLNYAWHTKDWQGAMAVLKKLEPEANAPEKINAFLNQYLQPQNIDADSRDFLRRMSVLAS
jgi:Zn-dependent peptidase ImmA (M78 family)